MQGQWNTRRRSALSLIPTNFLSLSSWSNCLCCGGDTSCGVLESPHTVVIIDLYTSPTQILDSHGLAFTRRSCASTRCTNVTMQDKKRVLSDIGCNSSERRWKPRAEKPSDQTPYHLEVLYTLPTITLRRDINDPIDQRFKGCTHISIIF